MSMMVTRNESCRLRAETMLFMLIKFKKSSFMWNGASEKVAVNWDS
jgi:hypothetical protein